jgi:NAD(P)H dehydrogenase (quinone)
MSKNIFILSGNPLQTSFSNAIAECYGARARDKGAEVRITHLADLAFDPVLHHGYASRQELEPCLQQARADILWCNHLVVVIPVWWGGMPAGLKGFFDRTFLPGFAFNYHSNLKWDKLLSGRSADVILTMDAPLWYYWWLSGRPLSRQIKGAILEFCGFKPVRIKAFASMNQSSEDKRKLWLNQISKMAEAVAVR